ncbi:MAG: hypothetical protein FJ264_15300 [Planctomycetes bacterium]|nr:hypothetical protein [Planctomycetota bacterium]
MSIPRKQNHLGIWKSLFKKRSASYGIKLLYTSLHGKDIVYNPCKCLEFYLKWKDDSPDNVQILLRCAMFDRKRRPYVCGAFPEKKDSFMHDVPAPCVYNEYIAPKEYVELKYTHVFRLFYAIKDDQTLLRKISPNGSAEETRKRLEQCNDVVKISAIWNEKPSEYFLIEVPKVSSVLLTSDFHPRIKNIRQAYNRWTGHIDTWLEKHYGGKWSNNLEQALEVEDERLGRKKDTNTPKSKKRS